MLGSRSRLVSRTWVGVDIAEKVEGPLQDHRPLQGGPPLLPSCRWGWEQNLQAPEACEDLLSSALLTRYGAQSSLPPSVDKCQTYPVLSPCPDHLPSSAASSIVFISPCCFAQAGVSSAETLSQHLSVTSLGFKIPSWESPYRPWRLAVSFLSHPGRQKPKWVEGWGMCQPSGQQN